jgi:hypothetical protein
MNIRPKRWLHDGALRTTPSGDKFFILECEAISPPSSVGRTVYLWLDVEETTDLLKELRGKAIADRFRSMQGDQT